MEEIDSSDSGHDLLTATDLHVSLLMLDEMLIRSRFVLIKFRQSVSQEVCISYRVVPTNVE